MRIRGIKRGRIIELTEELEIPDGCEIAIEIPSQIFLGTEERWQRLSQLFGAWSNQPDLDANFDAIADERHRYRGRDLPNFD
ncbi:MAG: hypothetical protein ACP5D7_21385 [Limnospira sp.]